MMVHLNVHGEAFVGKYRAERRDRPARADSTRPPSRSSCAASGSSTGCWTAGTEHGPADILHIKGMTDADGLRGLSPVAAVPARARALEQPRRRRRRRWRANDARPSGILTVAGAAVARRGRGRSASAGTPATAARWTPAGSRSWPATSSSRRSRSRATTRSSSSSASCRAREVARIFRVPAVGDRRADRRLADLRERRRAGRAFVTFCLRPWLVRIERAISGDPDLCPGVTYVEFDLDGLLRADADRPRRASTPPR